MIIAATFPYGGYWLTEHYNAYSFVDAAVLYYTISGNTLNWYNKVDSSRQFNTSATYHYIAFG